MKKATAKSAFSVYKASQEAKKREMALAGAGHHDSGDHRIRNGDLSMPLAMTPHKANLFVGKRKKRKKASMRTELLKKKASASSELRTIPSDDELGDDVLGECPPAKRRLKTSKSHHRGEKAKMVARSGEHQRDNVTPGKGKLNLADSRFEASDVFDWLIYPEKADNFFRTVWEQKPLRVRRSCADYYENSFSTAELDDILSKHSLEFGVNIDVTSYTKGQRQTLNPPGRALPSAVWDFFKKGCSVRLLNPQSFSSSVWKLCSTLQEYFSCFVGANIYLTPAGSQGFAPHYDDIEAFVLQLEGRKRWRVYKPRSDNEVLPRFSSQNFSQSEIGEPMMDVVLESGDLLYFPRGFIHQASTPPDSHSLHMTMSTCQKNTWGDLMEKMLPQVLQTAFEEDVEFRKSLPRDYLHHVGAMNSDSPSPQRADFVRHVERLLAKLKSYLTVDSAADQMATEYMHTALPPCLSSEERHCSAAELGFRWHNGRVIKNRSLHLTSEVRLVRHGALRLVPGEESLSVLYTANNSRVYKEKELQTLEIDFDFADAVEHLLNTYPQYVPIESLPLESDDAKMELATILFNHHLLLTRPEPVAAAAITTDIDFV